MTVNVLRWVRKLGQWSSRSHVVTADMNPEHNSRLLSIAITQEAGYINTVTVK